MQLLHLTFSFVFFKVQNKVFYFTFFRKPASGIQVKPAQYKWDVRMWLLLSRSNTGYDSLALVAVQTFLETGFQVGRSQSHFCYITRSRSHFWWHLYFDIVTCDRKAHLFCVYADEPLQNVLHTCGYNKKIQPDNFWMKMYCEIVSLW